MSLKITFQLPLRATQGLLSSLVELMEVPIQVPDYTTICRRQLELEIPSLIPNESRHIDSTGLKIFGEGDWKVHQHGHDTNLAKTTFRNR